MFKKSDSGTGYFCSAPAVTKRNHFCSAFRPNYKYDMCCQPCRVDGTFEDWLRTVSLFLECLWVELKATKIHIDHYSLCYMAFGQQRSKTATSEKISSAQSFNDFFIHVHVWTLWMNFTASLSPSLFYIIPPPSSSSFACFETLDWLLHTSHTLPTGVVFIFTSRLLWLAFK